MSGVIDWLLSNSTIGSTSVGKSAQYAVCKAYELSRGNLFGASSACKCRIYGQCGILGIGGFLGGLGL